MGQKEENQVKRYAQGLKGFQWQNVREADIRNHAHKQLAKLKRDEEGERLSREAAEREARGYSGRPDLRKWSEQRGSSTN